MVRVSYDGIIGDAPCEALPLERLSEVSDILRRHAYFTMVEGKMDTHNTGAMRNKSKGNSTKGLPAELSRVNLNAAGIDVGASSHFVAVSKGRSEQPESLCQFGRWWGCRRRRSEVAHGRKLWGPLNTGTEASDRSLTLFVLLGRSRTGR